MRRRHIVQGLPAAALVLAWPGRALGRSLNGFDLRGALVPVEAIEAGGPPRDGIPAIDRPVHEPAGLAALAPQDRVLGLWHGGRARAYPVRILNWHEIVNDRIGDDAIAVTYCPLCGTGMAFDARVGGQATSFGVSGLLYNSDVLLYDRRTESLWSQILAKAVTGPMKGRELAPVPLTHTTWAAWRQRHPATEVLSTRTGFERDYARDPYDGYEQSTRLMFNVRHRDDRIFIKEWVLGLKLGGEAKAYPFAQLSRRVDAQGRLSDRLGGRALEIRYDRAGGSAEAFDAGGRRLPSIMAYWFAWVAFHPDTQVLA